MNTIVETGTKLAKSALALKIGKAVMSRTGLIGIGIGGVTIGAGYLAYNFFGKQKKQQNLKRIDDISNNNREVSGKQIVI